MLYTSSKAALHNLYQAAKEKFESTNIEIDIFHPPRFQSKLIKSLKKKGNFTNIDVIAKTLFKKIK
jgi:NAD(P)-dependent dehydrogenase (short-subunit alcohol dehydrogenase family)